MLPYRTLRVERLEGWLDDLHGQGEATAGGDPRPPPASEIEAGCIRRACKRLAERAPFLCGLLGQQMPALARNDIGGFWRALRRLGGLADMLAHLAGKFKVSLLGNYRSLLPHWQRAGVAG